MLVADLHHFLDLTADTPAPARRLGEHLASIVAAATAGSVGAPGKAPCRADADPPTIPARAASS